MMVDITILQLFSSPNLKRTIYSLCEKSTEKRSKKTRLRALFQSLMWSADLIIINNDDIREYFEDKDNIGGNCYNSNSYWHGYSAIQLMFNMLVIQLVLKQIQILQYYIWGGGEKCKKEYYDGGADEKISATGWKRVH